MYPVAPDTEFQLNDTCALPGVAVRPVGMAGPLDADAHARMDASAFNRPPLTVMPVIDAMCATLFIRLLLSPAVSSAHFDSTSAAAPDTCGVAIDVPLKLA